MSDRAPLRVQQITQTPGTGAAQLQVAGTAWVQFRAKYGDGGTVPYCRTDNLNNFEIALGTLTYGTPDIITPTSIIASSNGGGAVNWGTQECSIFAIELADSSYFQEIGTSYPVQISDWGNTLVYRGSSATTISLPSSAELPKGWSVCISNQSASGKITFQFTGGQSWLGTNYTVYPGQTLAVIPALGQWIGAGVDLSNLSLAKITATGANTARPLADIAADRINVKNYGAVGDNTVDSTSAFNQAAAVAIARNINTVYAPAGQYKITGSLNFTFNGSGGLRASTLNLIGDGIAATVLNSHLVEAFPVLDCTGNTQATLQDFSILQEVGCLSTHTVFFAKPAAHPTGIGREPRLQNVSLVRQRTNTGACLLSMACDLTSTWGCEFQGRVPAIVGNWLPTGITPVSGVFPQGTLSKFQGVNATPDYTQALIFDSKLWGSDCTIDNWGGTGSRLEVIGGYQTVFGTVAAIDGARGHVHMRKQVDGDAAGTVRIWGTRFEAVPDNGNLDGILIAHGQIVYPDLSIAADCDAPIFFVQSGMFVAAARILQFSSVQAQPVFAGTGIVIAPQVVGNRPLRVSGGPNVSQGTNLGAGGNSVLSSPNGSRQAGNVLKPGFRIGGTDPTAPGAGIMSYPRDRSIGTNLVHVCGSNGWEMFSWTLGATNNMVLTPISSTEYGDAGRPAYYMGGEAFGGRGGDVYLGGGWSDISQWGDTWITAGAQKNLAKFTYTTGNWPGYLEFVAAGDAADGNCVINAKDSGLVLNSGRGWVKIPLGTSDPDPRSEPGGLLYYNIATNSLKVWSSGAWKTVQLV